MRKCALWRSVRQSLVGVHIRTVTSTLDQGLGKCCGKSRTAAIIWRANSFRSMKTPWSSPCMCQGASNTDRTHAANILFIEFRLPRCCFTKAM